MTDDHHPQTDTPHALARVAQQRAIHARRRRVQRQVRAAQAQGLESPVSMPVSASAARIGNSPAQRQGGRAEDRAAAYLQDAGLTLLARNLSCRFGEIDLVCLDGQHSGEQALVFVEVRERQGSRFGGAAASIDAVKQQRLVKAAQYWLPDLRRRHFHGRLPACRFDVVALDGAKIRWIRHAFALPV